MTGRDAARRIEFETDGETLYVRDGIESERLTLRFDREPDPQPAITDLFPVPVDRAVSFEAESISVPSYSSVTINESDGEFVAMLTEDLSLPRGAYCFDITGTTKVFVRAVDVSIEATEMAGEDPVEITFDRPTTITVGGRSLHTRPEATITVPDDPEALMTAVSALGSSIAEWSPERSWPTLRGYPPRIERGDELHVPDHLSIPDTGIEIAVPPTYADIYRIAPLAYYLGAAVVPGAEPEIRLDTGYVEPLPSEGPALEERVSELLRTTLFLDSLVRTEGYVPSDRYEYEQVGPDLPFYPPKLADRSVSEQLMEYLEVDPEILEPYAPPWPTWAVLRPGPAGAELLPHLAHLVAPIRVRGSPLDGDDGDDAGAPTTNRPLALATSPYLPPDGGVPNPDDEPLPSGVSALRPAGYETLLSGSRSVEGDVRVAFLVDSPERADAGRRAMSEPAPPDGVDSWEVYERPSREEIVEMLTDPAVDLLYCSLPTDGSRIVHEDGGIDLAGIRTLPAATVFERTGTVAPAHRSVESGSVGSVAADGPLDASRIRSLVGLLASATPLALSVALAGVQEAGDIRLAGDPGVVVATPKPGSYKYRCVVKIQSSSSKTHIAESHTALSTDSRVGAESTCVHNWGQQLPELGGIPQTEPESLSGTQVLDLIPEPDGIVDLNGQIVFQSDGLTESDIEQSARDALADEDETSDRPDMRSLIQPDSE
ncbi:hypothetical protein J2751_000088 [Halorubrum alkaliphilum]|uniref:Uncharacterized protein n=1 Tax=Halorubrum alkaliphilum TaxID=261290 RepID=A0A8T4GDA8_9EURY|nr:hypothetical protein [Halorubrum alkaliphilum]MBP1921105.1 hypothetical protein [Halorubrum alkaliphilum]